MNHQEENKMNVKNFLLGIGTLALIAPLGCAHKQPQRIARQTTHTKTTRTIPQEEGRNLDNSAAKEVSAHNFAEIEFQPGSADLTEGARESLRRAVEKADQSGKIDEVIVLSWSDQEYPSAQAKKLSQSEVNLAEKRNEAVEKEIKAIRNVDVDAYNMAKRPNAFSRLLNTTDSQLKSSMVAAGLPTTSDTDQFPSKASRSVVLIKLE
jgi:hypothetical protein